MLFGKSYYESKSIVKPGRIIFQGNPYKINYLHLNYFIKKYYIVVNNKRDNIFNDLIIYKCFHPNVVYDNIESININNPPKYSKFCLPEWVYSSKFINSEVHQKMFRKEIDKPKYNIVSDMYLRMAFLSIWALDNPHHEPSSEHVNTEPKLPFF